MKNSSPTRFLALDGYRGLAIILVFLGHTSIPYHFLPLPIPSWVSLLINQTIQGSGFLGVAIFFILSGFLITYLYPNPDNSLNFIQKRYTRIFPVFVTVCLANLALTVFPHLTWYQSFAVIFTPAIIVHFVWVRIIKKIHKPNLSKIIFSSFFSLQIAVGTIAFLLSSVYTITDYVNAPYFIQMLISGIVSSTLTFPLAGNVPVFNTLYWTLAIEILFYLLYPTVLSKIINSKIIKENKKKLLLLLLLIPVCYLIRITTLDTLSLGYIQLHLFYHFFSGMALGYLYRKRNKIINTLSKYFNNHFYFAPITIMFIIFVVYHALHNNYENFSALIQISTAPPLTFLLAISLNKKTILSKIFSSRFFVFIGRISYSMYLCHLIIISLLYTIFIPHKTNNFIQVFEELMFVLIAFILTVITSYILFQLLEKPYFTKRAENILAAKNTIKLPEKK